jgi:hypothetical protein
MSFKISPDFVDVVSEAQRELMQLRWKNPKKQIHRLQSKEVREAENRFDFKNN